MLMRLDVRRIKAVWIKADHRYQVKSTAEDRRNQSIGAVLVELWPTRTFAIPSVRQGKPGAFSG